MHMLGLVIVPDLSWESLDKVMGAVRVFSQGTPQGDDLTALVVKYSGAESKP